MDPGSGGKLESFVFALIIVIVMTVIRATALFNAPYDIVTPEIGHWIRSLLHIDGKMPQSFVDMPPLLIELIKYSANNCSDAACLRLIAPFLQSITAIAIFFIGAHLYSRRVGFWSCIAYVTMPFVSFESVYISEISLYLVFLSLTLLCFVKAIEHNNIFWWIFMIPPMAGCLLSSYFGWLVIPTFILYLGTIKAKRRILYSFPMIASFCAAIAISWRVISWQIDNGFITILALKNRILEKSIGLNIEQAIDYMKDHLLLFGPLFFPFFLLYIIRPEWKDEKHRLLTFFFFPYMIAGLLLSAIFGFNIPWFAIIYVPAIIITMNDMLRGGREYFQKAGMIISIIAMFMIQSGSVTTIPFDPYDKETKPKTWTPLLNKTAKIAKSYPRSFIASDDDNIVLAMMYAWRSSTPFQALKLHRYKNGTYIKSDIDYSSAIANAQGKRAIIISSHDKKDAGHIASQCISFKQLEDHFEYSKDKFYYFYICDGFRGI